jgi:nitrite reductase/ring-hydroxylating ferredoxin subunit
MRSKSKWVYVCRSEDLGEREHIALDVNYSGELQASVVFRFKEKIYAFINRCVHMPRKLNCERDIIFDDTGDYLRCSMHGIIYDPETGTSQSTMCNGEKLQALKVVEEDACIYINDKRVSAESGDS